jgi:hypothetical protein
MELTRRYLAMYPTRFAAYVALEVALMRRFVATGGTEEEFCRRLAPAFARRYGFLLRGHPAVLPLPAIPSAPAPRRTPRRRRLAA